MPQRNKKKQGGNKRNRNKNQKKKSQNKSPKKSSTNNNNNEDQLNGVKDQISKPKPDEEVKVNGTDDRTESMTTESMTTQSTTTQSTTTTTDRNKDEEESKKPMTEQEKLKDAMWNITKKKEKRNRDKPHKFWNEQPVPSMDEKFDEEVNEAMENKTLDDVRKQPLLLPPQFEWVELDLTDDKEVDELYNLLANHYVEDDDNRFRFNYSKEFLRWALMVPGYLKTWHLGMYTTSLYAYIYYLSAHIFILAQESESLNQEHYVDVLQQYQRQ